MNLTDSETAKRRTAALAEAEALIDRLYAESEAHREELSQAIHDEMGALLVSAAMDFTSVRQKVASLDVTVREQLDRGRSTLQSAVDVSRRMVEDLRPSILNNFGLFAALKWQLKRASDGSAAELTENYPVIEPHFHPRALTALFRVAQEAIGLIFNRGSVTAAGINIQVENGGILMVFTDNGIPTMVGGFEVGAADALASMKHRIRALGGTIELLRTDASGTVVKAFMPLPEGLGPSKNNAQGAPDGVD